MLLTHSLPPQLSFSIQTWPLPSSSRLPSCPGTQALETLLQHLRAPVPGESQLPATPGKQNLFPQWSWGQGTSFHFAADLFQFLATLPHSKDFPYIRICCGGRGVSRGLLPQHPCSISETEVRKEWFTFPATGWQEAVKHHKGRTQQLKWKGVFCQNQEHFLHIPE